MAVVEDNRLATMINGGSVRGALTSHQSADIRFAIQSGKEKVISATRKSPGKAIIVTTSVVEPIQCCNRGHIHL